jgi:ATP-dependent DNA helicase RecG
MSETAVKQNLRLDTELQFVKGIGPKLASVFSKNGIKTVGDFFQNYPRAYEDRRSARHISTLKEDDIVSLKASIVNVSSYSMGRSSRKIYDILIKDESAQIRCKFFRVPYKGYFERFKPYQEVRVVGKVTNYRGRLEFHHPELKDVEVENLDVAVQDLLVPIYVENEGIASNKIHKLIESAFQQLKEFPEESFPVSLMKNHDLVTRAEALQRIHFPDVDFANDYHVFKSKSHKRIIFEEFFWLEMYLAARKSGLKKEKGVLIENKGALARRLEKSLPFELTMAQKKSFAEIKTDFRSGQPMNRLVQGDVGSGKTLVSFLAIAEAFESGFQSCLMAPTEILAEQHFKNAQKMLTNLGITVGMLTGKTKAKDRVLLLEKLKSNEVHLLIGTHALIEDWVQFQKLGLVIIDEQHRFGVAQRGLLKNKGQASLPPHFLIMTATPIPRTLAMTVYGDLDVSIINEMPKNRIPIQTRVITETKRAQAVKFMIEQIEKGRQAYVVYPLVEESEKIDLKNATDEYEKLKNEFPKVRFGLLHGKMKPVEKDEIMTLFREHKIDILVSTTVIEVGVDVPNANLMMIEHSERFGLSQLHQLRGRVGRGEFKSYCVMIMGYAMSPETRERIEFMEKTNDGFKVAEFDLEIRGPGEFMGSKQSGLPGFKMANLVRDFELLKLARDSAFEILKTDPDLKRKENQFLKEELIKTHGPTALAGIG